MGVPAKKRDIEEQRRRYQAAQAAALRAEERFARACREERPDAECQSLWAAVGEAVRSLEAEWRAYQKIAPARMRQKAA